MCPGFESLIRHHFFRIPSVHLLKCLLLAVAGLAFAAHAQLRSIPPEARPGVLRHVQDMLIELDGKPARLSPGAQIRDTHNRVVLPTALVDKTAVRYVPDAAGMVHRVWILAPGEK